MDLPDFSYTSNYTRINGLNLHFLDEGCKDAPLTLFLHGVPTWSFTFRKIFPVFVNAGYRTVLPDLPGFGFSDKPVEKKYYEIEFTVSLLFSFIRQFGREKVNLICHDWGAVLGMILLSRDPELFKAVILSNGLLPDGDMRLPFTFYLWKYYVKYYPGIKAGRAVKMGCLRKPDKSVIQAYNLPLLNENDKTAFHLYPQLIPFKGYNREVAADSWIRLQKTQNPILTVFSTKDPVTKGGEKYILNRIPGAASQRHVRLHAGHFIQEDAPGEFASSALDFLNRQNDDRL